MTTDYGSPIEVAKRIREYLGKYGRENTSSLLLYEAMKALETHATAAPAPNAETGEKLPDCNCLMPNGFHSHECPVHKVMREAFEAQLNPIWSREMFGANEDTELAGQYVDSWAQGGWMVWQNLWPRLRAALCATKEPS